MPPSGFNQEQADALVDFLRSCAHTLRAEAAESGESLTEATEREIREIAEAKRAQTFAPLQAAVLDLTAGFYRELRKALEEGGGDFETSVEVASKVTTASILSIRI